ncbi:MAG: YggS family pyridoxal phosphate-dependent enzyme [Deltaproteobacteria bacterium]|nr:YggS family pyridoxal phosphate-dependent enzyme [Deltaproteobacteria bacterium]
MSAASAPIAERLAAVRAEIGAAAREAGRDPSAVELVVVTKTRTATEIAAAISAGAHLLGENYVQEARRKIPEVEALLPGHGARWHVIGPLQTNKAKYVPGTFAAVESVDRVELADALAKRAAAAGLVLPVLIQVNVGREPQKAGVLPEGLAALLESLAGMASLAIGGLMAIPPECDDPADARPYFRALAESARRLSGRGLLPPAPVLSMGMSHDFAAAIAEGATRVRVGTAIFGPRPTGAEE